MKKIFALLVLSITCTLYSQTKFEKGYFITTEGNKVECLIKNEDWIGIPDKIEYKLDINSTIKEVEKESLDKIHIENILLIERHEVLIERYSKDLNELSNSRLINPKKESLLLKVVANGPAKLLKYSDKGVLYFFYELNSEIAPLEYKLYKTKKGTVGKNLNYQKTLREKLNCNNVNLKSNIRYTEKTLIKYIKKYNFCFSNTKTEIFSQIDKKDIINFRGKISIGSSGLEDHSIQLSFKIGGEFEYVFPFNNNKWSIFIEPTYQSFSQNGNVSVGFREIVISPSGDTSTVAEYMEGEISYQSIEIPVGLRHYFFLNSNNKIFANAGFNLDWAFDEYLLKKPTERVEINTTTNYFLGLGYELDKKYSIEFRYNTARDLSRLSSGANNFYNYSIKLGYNFL
jgi:hypothetical protein